MDTERLIATLNALLQTSRDGALGFQSCMRDVKSKSLAPMLEASAERCKKAAAELEAAISRLGGEPAPSGSVAGALRRAWTDIISSLTGMEENIALEECERGEDAAMRAYEAALEEDLPLEIERMVRRQYAGVKENHYRIRALRDLTAQAS